MADILHSVPIKASPKAVYTAITDPEGLRSWWTTDVEAEAREGSLAVFGFEGGQVQMRMRVKSLSPGRPCAGRWRNPRRPNGRAPRSAGTCPKTMAAQACSSPTVAGNRRRTPSRSSTTAGVTTW